MKNLFYGGALLLVALVVCSFSAPLDNSMDKNTIKWYTWEEAIKASEKSPKKIIVDVYTDWCGWCKRMDKTTFAEAKVAAYINEHFYPVKFDAEQKGDIKYKGHVLRYRSSGKRGVHDLAYSLLDGRLGYPSVVYLDEEQNRISISPGYKAANDMLKELKFIAGDHYKTTTFNDFTGEE